jgi:hypothetical protein
MILEVSVGESLDKLSILLIKLEKIQEETRRTEVQKEISALSPVEALRVKYAFYCDLLKYFNTVIWELTDDVKAGVDDDVFIEKAKMIFDFNQKRFTIKNLINNEEDSAIKEQKSYTHTHVNIEVDTLVDAIPVVNYLLSSYDTVLFEGTYAETISSIIHLKKIMKGHRVGENLRVSNLRIPGTNKAVYDYQPIRYASGGLLGDFIHQLSVINEVFLKTGRRGKLYVRNIPGDEFRFGLERVYADTYPIVSIQPYILSYEIHTGEAIDVDLSSWRRTPLYQGNWETIFRRAYGIDWGKNPWITGIPPDASYKNTIIVSHSVRREDSRIDYPTIFSDVKSRGLRVVFALLGDSSEYIAFHARTGIELECVHFETISSFVSAVNGCHLFIGNLSFPMTIAHALHKEKICILANCPDDIHVNGLYTSFTDSAEWNRKILDDRCIRPVG